MTTLCGQLALLRPRRFAPCGVLALAAVLTLLAATSARAQDLDLSSGARAIPQLVDVEALLDFPADERAALDAVVDGAVGLDSEAIYVLLRRSLMAGEEDVLLEGAAPASLDNVTASPGVFRGRILLLHLEVYRVSRHRPALKASARWWGRHDCWRLDCLDRRSGKPIVLVLAELPPWLDLRDYPEALRCSAAAFFLGMASLPAADGETQADFPVFVTRTLYGRAAGRSHLGHVMFFLLLACLGAWWLILKRRAARSGANARTALRARAAGLVDDVHPPTGEYDEAAVNQQLVEEIRRFRQGGEGERDIDDEASARP